LAASDYVFVSGISLAILPADDRRGLLSLLTELAERGRTIAFDTNFRRALWSSLEEARTAAETLFRAANLVFATFEDEQLLWGDATAAETLARLHASGTRCVALKLGSEGCLYSDGKTIIRSAATPVASVIDTTAAGDAFNAGFLSGWIRDLPPEHCCRLGNRLAATVIQHRGAIIPLSAMPT